MSERILIFGGRGFIGGRLAEIARQDGHTVKVFDRQVEPHLDVLNMNAVCEVFRSWYPSLVYYLITPSFSEARGDSPLHFQAGVHGALNVGQNAVISGVKKIVWASSAMIYNSETQNKYEYSVISPQNFYGLSKVLMEDIARYVGRSTVTRFFNVYGPTQTDARLLPHIIATVREQIAAGKSPEVHLGSLTAQRDFVYVDDVARSILDLALQPSYDTVNIGTGVGTSVGDVILKIEQIIDRKIKIVVDPDRIRPDEWPRLVADTHRLKSLLPTVSFRSLDEGLKELL